MKPWREIAKPHEDVLAGSFQQSEFAADITSVQSGTAPAVYQDPALFFGRTYITEGMRLLLTQVLQRLSGRGGEPVIQLQTAFGGGKTHTMLAVLHLARGRCPDSELPGIPAILAQAGLADAPRATVAVLDGTALSPGQPWMRQGQPVRTLWGELGWQLGGAAGLAMVQQADATGVSPGKEPLRRLLETYAPCVVLVDELVAFIRQFPDGKSLSGGTYDSNLSFVQALTEAAKQVPTAVVLASLPESEIEAGSSRGVGALRALEKTFGRVQALWKPVASEEAFEIVRRRLFEPIAHPADRDAVCRAFADAYLSEGARFPSETQEARYYERLRQAYPIHPEFFDRLYEDWTTIDGFQRTRGVLKLMAKVISRLWKDEKADLMIMPGSLPLAHPDVRNELTYLLPPGWDPVIEGDLDGERAEATELDMREPRFGEVSAARRVTRTLFLGTAPSSVAARPGIRGLDRGRVLLGCAQPSQPTAVFSDALNRLSERLHYLNSSGDRASDTTRYWLDTRANLRREMEDRKRRYDEKTDVRRKIEEVLKKQFTGIPLLDGVHLFTPHGDVPDDSALRLILLAPEHWFMKEARQQAEQAVREYLRNHGNQPRHRANRLLFLAPDQAALSRFQEATRIALAWKSIVDDVDEGRLNIDQNQRRQAVKELKAAEDVLPRAARETYRWLLCPYQEDATATMPTIEAHLLNISSVNNASIAAEFERTCRENELVIERWSPVHLKNLLLQFYWKRDRPAIVASRFWEDTLKYVFLPRLRSKGVLEAAISKGASSGGFFGIAYGESEGAYLGFDLTADNAILDDTLLLIEPNAALAYDHSLSEPKPPQPPIDEPELKPDNGVKEEGPGKWVIGPGGGGVKVIVDPPPHPPTKPPVPSAHTFHGSVEISAALAKTKLNQLAEEVIARLHSDPNATVRITVEIDADFPHGATDSIRRTIDANTSHLGFKLSEWE